MKLPRFRVATCEGFPITQDNREQRRSSRKPPGLSAHVLDSLHQYTLVATYRSEDTRRDGRPGSTRIGREGALRRAEEHAARLNEVHRLVLHTQAQARSRARANG